MNTEKRRIFITNNFPTIVAADHQVRQAQEEMMKERAQAHASRQQQIYNSMYPSNGRNRTYPLMTASYSGQRYPTQSVPATNSRLQMSTSYHNQQTLAPPERLARSPIPMEEMEPMAPPNTQFAPPQRPGGNCPPNIHFPPPPPPQGPGGNCYPPFTEPQIAAYPHQEVHHHEAHLPQQQSHSQQIYNHHHHHPTTHPSAAQPPVSQQGAGLHQTLGGGGGGGGYNTTTSYPPQVILHGQQYPGCVPPPAPVEPVYLVPVEGGAYYDQHIPPAPQHHHDVLTLNTPTGAMIENLLPGVPPLPTGSANSYAAAAPQSIPPATSTDHCSEPETGEAECHRLPGSSPQYTQSSYGVLLLPSTAATVGYGSASASKDILCGQGGN